MKKNGSALKLQGDIEKHAWVRFAAHGLDMADGDDDDEVLDEAAEIADKMIAKYRERVGG